VKHLDSESSNLRRSGLKSMSIRLLALFVKCNQGC
jgi:hypothetical protein